MSYRVLKVTGDYPTRQEQANEWGAQLYLEQHFNSKANDRAEDADNYSCALVAHNASTRSKEVAAYYAKLSGERLGLKNAGTVQAAYGKNGDGNLRHTDMPAVILEPLFVSDLSQAELASSADGIEQVARLLVDTVKWALPNGGKVALSPGHKHQDSKKDPGAPTANGFWEADLADKVIDRAVVLLAADDDEVPETQREGGAPRTEPTTIGADVMRALLKETLAPIEGQLDKVHKLTSTTADNMVEVVTKVDRLVEHREKDRRDIDRILSHLGMTVQ